MHNPPPQMSQAQALKKAEEQGYHAPAQTRPKIRPKPNAKSNIHKDLKQQPPPAERKEQQERRHACLPSLNTHQVSPPRTPNTPPPQVPTLLTIAPQEIMEAEQFYDT